MAEKEIRTVIYPGSFDPITNGHLDIIERASRIFDKVIVVIGTNPEKQPLFTADERLEMIRGAVAHIDGIEIDHFSGLIVDSAKERGAVAIIRGLRALSDFEFEFQLALMNRHMEPEINTVFLMPHERYTHLNSSIVRELAHFGRDVTEFVPPIVTQYLKQKSNG
jgi:pantetheine-phosphate adenylyltransferase